jgi:hypothetical protein
MMQLQSFLSRQSHEPSGMTACRWSCKKSGKTKSAKQIGYAGKAGETRREE